MLENLRKFVAPELMTGLDSRMRVGQYTHNLGLTNVLVVTDQGVNDSGWTSEILAILEEHAIANTVFMDLTPNPKDYEVHLGVEAYHSNKCDGIIAVGGGSVVDCAKGIGIIATNGGSIIEYEGVDTITSPCPPLICIPTTAGASADVSQFAIIGDSGRSIKMAIVSKALVPDVSLIDPVTTTTMDKELTANTGMDALTHSFEALASNASSSITTLHALESIRLISVNLKAAFDNSLDLEAREGMMLGSLHAGFAFSNASLGAVHALAHALGGYYDLPHGECNAILLPHVIAYNYKHAQPEYDKACRIFAPDRAPSLDTLLDSIHHLMLSVNITGNLSSLGVKETDFTSLSDTALNDACMATNPITPSRDDLIRIIQNAF